MSTTPSWVLDPDRLKESLAAWLATNPTAQHKNLVNEFLMDLVERGPNECGEEDDDTGIFTGVAGNVVGGMIFVVYVPDFGRRRIAVTGISLMG